MIAGIAEAVGVRASTVEHIKIEESEADRLATTFAGVARWYDMPDVGEKAADHYAFLLTVAMVYGAKIVAEWNDRRNDRRNDARQGEIIPPEPVAPSSTASEQDPRQPPDPRNWRHVDVDGMGPIDIPPVTPTPH